MHDAHPATSTRVRALAPAALLPLLALAWPGEAAAQRQSAPTPPSSVAPPPAGWSRAPRWQAVLSDGSYLWEITPAGLRGDTLVVRQADSVLRVPLERVDELRLIRPTERSIVVGGGAVGGGTLATLSGADDAIYQLVRFPVSQRRQIVERILADHPPAGDSAASRPGRP
jgi:hypothetical protein